MYKKFFNAENPFWTGMGEFFDVVVLNVFWLFCCIPIFTIGPATAAFAAGLRCVAIGEDANVTSVFFRTFRRCFKSGILLGLPLSALLIFLGFDVYLCHESGTGIYTFFMVFFAVLFLMAAFITLYAFPLLARSENLRASEVLLWAFTLSLKHIGKTLFMIIMLVISLWFIHILPGTVFIMFGLVGYLISNIIERILNKSKVVL